MLGKLCIGAGIGWTFTGHKRARPGAVIRATTGVAAVTSIFGFARFAAFYAFTGVASKFILHEAIGAIQGAEEIRTFSLAGHLGGKSLIIGREASVHTVVAAAGTTSACCAHASVYQGTITGLPIDQEEV